MANVLIIDSEAPVAQALKNALTARGVESHLTADGTEGLDYVKSNKPDLIVLCVELTRGSGYSVCNKLKKDGAMASIPLILTSSQATEETFEQHKKLRTRAEAYIKKPYTTEEILKVVGEYVKLGAPKAAEVELSIDELEVEIPNVASQAAPKRPVMPSDDEEFLDVTFDGEDSGANEAPVEVVKPAAKPAPQVFAPEPSSTDIADSPMVSRSAVADSGRAVTGKANPAGDAELERLRNEVKTLRQRVQKLEQETQEKEVAFDDRLLEESTRARDALESKKKLAQVEREISKYQQQAAKAQAEAEAAQAHVKDMQAQNEGIGSERSALTDKIAQLVDKVKELASERDSLKREVAEMQEAQRNALSGVETAEKMREKARKAVDIAMQLLEETRLVH